MVVQALRRSKKLNQISVILSIFHTNFMNILIASGVSENVRKAGREGHSDILWTNGWTLWFSRPSDQKTARRFYSLRITVCRRYSRLIFYRILCLSPRGRNNWQRQTIRTKPISLARMLPVARCSKTRKGRKKRKLGISWERDFNFWTNAPEKRLEYPAIMRAITKDAAKRQIASREKLERGESRLGKGEGIAIPLRERTLNELGKAPEGN